MKRLVVFILIVDLATDIALGGAIGLGLNLDELVPRGPLPDTFRIGGVSFGTNDTTRTAFVSVQVEDAAPPVKYFWSFGDGSPLVEGNSTAQYRYSESPDLFLLTVIVVDSLGRMTSWTTAVRFE
jgi:hypothetical protein